MLRTDPENADALYYIAVVACQEGQFQQGAELARRALAKGPASARAHNLLGRALEALGEPLEAIKNFDQAIVLDANFAEAHSNRANILVKAGLPDEALVSFERALALDANSIPDLINRGALLQDIGRHAEALASYDRALALAPGDPGILMNRANALAMLDRFSEAEAVYDEVIRRNPKLALAYAHKGLAVKEQGRFEEARKLFEQAIDDRAGRSRHRLWAGAADADDGRLGPGGLAPVRAPCVAAATGLRAARISALERRAARRVPAGAAVGAGLGRHHTIRPLRRAARRARLCGDAADTAGAGAADAHAARRRARRHRGRRAQGRSPARALAAADVGGAGAAPQTELDP